MKSVVAGTKKVAEAKRFVGGHYSFLKKTTDEVISAFRHSAQENCPGCLAMWLRGSLGQSLSP